MSHTAYAVLILLLFTVVLNLVGPALVDLWRTPQADADVPENDQEVRNRLVYRSLRERDQ